jgi:transcriptional regulator GlxA family with amidase domain
LSPLTSTIVRSQRRPTARQVLVVDAGFATLSFLDVTLDGHCGVTSAATVIGAVQSLPHASPDVVVIDARAAMTHAGFLHELRARFPRAAVIAVEATGEPAITRAMAAAAFDRVFSRPTNPVALLERIVALLSLGHAWRGRLGSVSPYVTRAVAHVAAHYKDDPSVAGVARAVGISANHLGHLFDAALGMPVKEYIIKVRLLAARRLLLQTDDGLDVLAEECGFVDGSHLSRLFLRYVGQRPGEYRRVRTERSR